MTVDEDVQMDETEAHEERDDKEEGENTEERHEGQTQARGNGLTSSETVTALELFKSTLRAKKKYDQAQVS